jgi:thiol:disulfide interchange protein
MPKTSAKLGRRQLILTASGMLLATTPAFAARRIDWNDAALKWHRARDGLNAVRDEQRVGLLIVYADWCGVCREYAKLFRDPELIAAADGVVLIRENQDAKRVPQAFDTATYVPRTYFVDSKGEAVNDLIEPDPDYPNFLPTRNPQALIAALYALKERNV